MPSDQHPYETAGIEMDSGQRAKEPDKEGMFSAVAGLLDSGRSISSSELYTIADEFGINGSSASIMLNTNAGQLVMDAFGVIPVTRQYKGARIWVDFGGKTRPEEIARAKRAIEEVKKNAHNKRKQ